MSIRLRIKLKAYDHRLLDVSAKAIVNVARKTGSGVRGPVPLPMEIHKYTVNRSPHVDKKSREQFEMRVHKRLIDIINPGQATVEELTKLALPPGVDVEVKQ